MKKKKKKCPFLYQKISVIANKDFDIELIKKNNKRLYLYTEYIHLTNDWVKKNNLNIKVIDVSGETLQFLVNELCDLVVCISDEKDIKENNLKIIEEICVTELGFFSNSKYAETLKNLISV
jgi:ATP phosphoribosyltransferase